MKIGIVGNYGNDNNGDESILYSILQQVRQEFNITNEDITVFSNNAAQTAKRYGVTSHPLYYKKGMLYKTFFSTYKQNKQHVAKLDLLIIGGGGLLMDFYKRKHTLYGTYALMAKCRCSLHYLWLWAGPLDTWLVNGIRLCVNMQKNFGT